MLIPRRNFLQSSLALAATGASARDVAPSLPTVKLGKHDVTKLILGANPFYGYSHFSKLYDRHMVEWSTQENVCRTLRRCEECGINTWQLSHNDRSISDIRRHREEGGKLQWILTTSGKMVNSPELTRELAKLGPIAIIHQGVTADKRWAAGEKDKIRDYLKLVRDTGVLAGLATHNPVLIDSVEGAGWDLDFFMGCFYKYNRTPEELKTALGQMTVGETYLAEDPARMCRTIRQSKKPCLGFKILAAGRIESAVAVDNAFQFAFDNIKPQDPVVVGMYPRYTDQVGENCARVRRILQGHVSGD